MESMLKITSTLLLVAAGLSAQTLKVDALTNPSGPNSSQVNWSVTQDGNAIMSWVESDVLKYSIRKGGQWSEARVIASKRHFFHHPAELPEVIAMPNGAYMAHWIETPKPDSEAEFPFVSASRDGVKFSKPRKAFILGATRGDQAGIHFVIMSQVKVGLGIELAVNDYGKQNRYLTPEVLAIELLEPAAPGTDIIGETEDQNSA